MNSEPKTDSRTTADKTRRRPRILVVGLGNDLLADDGVGVHIARLLKQSTFGPGVTVVEVGTAILDALHLFERADFIVAIDAMQAGGAPGTVYKLSAEDVQKRDRLSMHDFTFTSALTLLKRRPRQVCFVGVEPEQIDYGLALTDHVRDALPLAAETVRRTIQAWQGLIDPDADSKVTAA